MGSVKGRRFERNDPAGQHAGQAPLRRDDSDEVAQWFETTLGKTLGQVTAESVNRLVPAGYYRSGFQAGFAPVNLLQRAESPFFQSLNQPNNCADGSPSALICRPEQLPFAARSIDLLALPFVLDFSLDPHAVLREAHSVLAPEGCLVICGFNRWSLWGLRRLLRLGVRQAPWSGSFLTLSQVQDWTRLLGLELVSAASVFYRLPIGQARLLQRTAFLEPAGDRWWPVFSGAYVIVVRKRAFGHSALLEPVRSARRRTQKPLVSALPRQVAKERLRVLRG